jgi:AAR2 protein
MSVIICLNVPKKVEVGIDLNVIETGPNFKGISNVPSGVHLFYQSPSVDSIRSSRFIQVSESDLIVFQWNKGTEELEEVDRISHLYDSVKRGFLDHEFDTSLGSYFDMVSSNGSPDSNVSSMTLYYDWKSLSRFITPHVVDIIQPINHIIRMSASEGDNKSVHRLFFSEILGADQFSLHDNKTKYGVDTSFAFEHMILLLVQTVASKGGAIDDVTVYFCGELQACFVLFFLGQSLEAYEHWKRMFDMICRCEQIFETYCCSEMFMFPIDDRKNSSTCSINMLQFFKMICECLQIHLKLIPNDFFQTDLTKKSFLVSDFAHLNTRLNQLRTFLSKSSDTATSVLTIDHLQLEATLNDILKIIEGHHYQDLVNETENGGAKLPTLPSSAVNEQYKDLSSLIAELQEMGEDAPSIEGSDEIIARIRDELASSRPSKSSEIENKQEEELSKVASELDVSQHEFAGLRMNVKITQSSL